MPDYALLAGPSAAHEASLPLLQLGYGEATLDSELRERQLQNTHRILMDLSEDGLLMPFRQMAGMPAPGEDLGGWYIYKADYDYRKDSAGLAPGGPQNWEIDTANGPVSMLSFTAISDQQYSTYSNVV